MPKQINNGIMSTTENISEVFQEVNFILLYMKKNKLLNITEASFYYIHWPSLSFFPPLWSHSTVEWNQ